MTIWKIKRKFLVKLSMFISNLNRYLVKTKATRKLAVALYKLDEIILDYLYPDDLEITFMEEK